MGAAGYREGGERSFSKCELFRSRSLDAKRRRKERLEPGRESAFGAELQKRA